VTLLPFLVLAAYHWRELPPLEASDYAQYLLHARALVEGRPYGDAGYIHTDANPLIGPAVLPPGYPLALAPVVAVAGVRSTLVRLPAIAGMCIFLLVAWKALARRHDALLTAGAVLMTGIAIELGRATIVSGADLGLAALLWTMVYVADGEQPWDTRRTAAIVLLGFAAMAFRLAGVVVIPALLLYGLTRPAGARLRPLLVTLIWITPPALLLLSGRVAIPTAFTYSLSWGAIWADVIDKLTTYRYALFESLLYPFSWRLANAVYHAAALPLVLLGAWRMGRLHRREFLGALFAAHVVMLLLVTVDEPRYVWVFYPVGALAMLLGLGRVMAWLPGVSATRARSAGIALAVAVALLAGARDLLRAHPDTLLGRPEVRAVIALLRDERSTQDPSRPARAVFMNPRVMALESDVPSMGLPRLPPAALLAELDRGRITHVIVGDLGMFPRQHAALAAAVAAYPRRFELIYENATFQVYRVRPASVARV
jgi:hypothetical protein